MCAKLKGSLRIVFLRGRERMVRPERFELPTYCSGGNRSIQLSYGRVLIEFTCGRAVQAMRESLWLADSEHSSAMQEFLRSPNCISKKAGAHICPCLFQS